MDEESYYSVTPTVISNVIAAHCQGMNVISDFSPEYIAAAEELERLMIFEDIDYRERVIKQPVLRNDELIEKMKAKVPIFRQWLADFHEKHMSQYPK